MKITDSYRNILSFIDKVVNGNDFSFQHSNRKLLAATLFDIANEHGKAINTLFEEKLDASGFSMMRIQFETFVRACWLLNCATDSEIEKFTENDNLLADDKRNLEFGTILREVESKLDFGSTLTEIKKSSWKALNSYTHGGLHQADRRFNGLTIEQHHDPEQVDECVKFSAMLTFLGFCQMVDICENGQLDKETLELYESIKGWVF